MSQPVYLLAEDESVGAIFLTQAVGARPAGMGEAFVAVANDVNTLFWNPAGMARIRNMELLVMHSEFIQDFRDEYFAFSMPWNAHHVFGVNGFISYGDPIEKASLTSSNLGTFNTYDTYLSLGWAYALDKQYSLGLTVKGLYQVIDEYAAWSVAADLGFLMLSIIPHLNLGLTLKNLGKPIRFIEESYLLPMTMEAGASYQLFNNQLLLTFDMTKPWQQEMVFKCGAEYNIEESLFFRIGYKYAQFGNDLGPLSGLSAGIGAELSDYKVDYAFTPYADFGNVHRISIVFPFGRSVVDEQKIIKRLEKKIKSRQEKIILSYKQRGDEHFQHAQYKQAISYYEKIISLTPDYSNIKKRIGQAKVRLKKSA